MLLTVLMAPVAEAIADENGSEETRSDQTLPLGFLEYLGGMIEMDEPSGKTWLDPLDFEGALDAQVPASDTGPNDSERTEEVAP